MFVRKKRTKNNPNVYVQLVESFRKNGSISQKVIKHIGTSVTEEQLEKIVLLANQIKDLYLANKDEQSIEIFRKQELSKINGSRSLTLNCIPIKKIIKGLDEVYGKIFDEMCLNRFIKNRSNYNEILKYIVNSKEQFCMPLPIPDKAREIYSSLNLTLNCDPYRYIN